MVVLGIGGLAAAIALTVGALALAGDVGTVVEPRITPSGSRSETSSPSRDDGDRSETPSPSVDDHGGEADDPSGSDDNSGSGSDNSGPGSDNSGSGSGSSDSGDD